MAKRGQKKKRAEKAKTQLKSSMKNAGKADRKKKIKGPSGIRLPKGLNEVKPEVKVKAIHLQNVEEPVSPFPLPAGRKFKPMKSILSELGHHAKFNRLEALRALKDILQCCPDKLNEDFPKVLTRLFGLLIDTEELVRDLCTEVAGLLLHKISKETMETFSAKIGAQLSRALSNFDQNIQLNTLKFLNALIASNPELIRCCSSELLSHCQQQTSQKTKKNFIEKSGLSDLRKIVFEAILKLCSEKLNDEGHKTLEVKITGQAPMQYIDLRVQDSWDSKNTLTSQHIAEYFLSKRS